MYDSQVAPSDELNKLPLATVIIPVLNEQQHIGDVLEQILKNIPSSVIEIIVVDGGSSDNTRSIVKEYCTLDSRLKIIDNPRRIQAAGVNSAAFSSSPLTEVIIRMDAHAGYRPSYLNDLLNEIKNRDADSVVVRLITVGETCFQRAVAFVSNNSFGTGGSAHRMGSTSGYVEHGHHAAIKKNVFLTLNGYDESFAVNEDAEFDHRLTLQGGKIWFCAEIAIRYFPRATPSTLAKQYFRYGNGRAQNFLKNRQRLRLRQGLPPAFFIYTIFAVPLFFFDSFFALPLVFYLTCIIFAAFKAFIVDKSHCAIGVVLALPIMHLSWGAGFLYRLFLRTQ